MTPELKKELKAYFKAIGSKGGKLSKRKITPEQQKKMQEGRLRSKGGGHT